MLIMKSENLIEEATLLKTTTFKDIRKFLRVYRVEKHIRHNIIIINR